MRTVLIATLSLLLLHGPSGHALDAAPNTVGLLLPLSGEFSYVGADIQRGLNDCMRTRNLKQKVHLHFEDSRSFDRKATLTAYKNLIAHNVDLVFATVVPEAKLLDTLVARSQRPLVLLWDNYDSLGLGAAHIKSIGFSVERSAEVSAEYAYRRLGKRRVAIIAAIDEWSEVAARAYRKRFEELGGDVVYYSELALSETDTAPALLKADRHGADSIFLPLYSNVLISILKQARALNSTQTLLTPEGLTDPVLSEIGPIADGVYSYRPTASVYGDQIATETLPAQVDPGFYGMGLSACHAIQEFIMHGRVPELNAPVVETMGHIIGGKWQPLALN